VVKIISWGNVVGIPKAIKKLLNDPRAWVLGFVVDWLVGGILDFVAQVFGLIYAAGQQAARAPGLIADGIGGAGGTVADLLLIMADTYIALGTTLVDAAGPIGFLVYGAITALIARGAIEGIPLLVEVLSPRIAAILETITFGRFG